MQQVSLTSLVGLFSVLAAGPAQADIDPRERESPISIRLSGPNVEIKSKGKDISVTSQSAKKPWRAPSAQDAIATIIGETTDGTAVASSVMYTSSEPEPDYAALIGERQTSPEATTPDPGSLVPNDYVAPLIYENFDSSNNTQPALRTAEMASAATATTASIAWQPSPNVREYLVFRDGKQIAVTKASEFSESGLTPGARHKYTVSASASSVNTAAYKIEIPVATLKPGIKAKDITGSAFESLMAPTTFMEFNYRTFIPDYRVSATFCAAGPWERGEFNGNNRSFMRPSPGETNSKSEMHVGVSFSRQTMQTYKYVGPTHLYKNGQLVETRQAPSNRVQFLNPYISSTYAKIRFDHQAKIPFCDAGPINFIADVQMWSSGAFKLQGSRIPVPAHEGWIRRSAYQPWENVFKVGNSGFHCLMVCSPEWLYFDK